jgi:hypothetical protein
MKDRKWQELMVAVRYAVYADHRLDTEDTADIRQKCTQNLPEASNWTKNLSGLGSDPTWSQFLSGRGLRELGQILLIFIRTGIWLWPISSKFLSGSPLRGAKGYSGVLI